MKEMDKEYYKVLDYYADTPRKLVDKGKRYSLDGKIEEKLVKLGYLIFNRKSKILYNENYILTQKGAEVYHKLREDWRKDWTLWIAIIAFIVATISLAVSLS